MRGSAIQTGLVTTCFHFFWGREGGVCFLSLLGLVLVAVLRSWLRSGCFCGACVACCVCAVFVLLVRALVLESALCLALVFLVVRALPRSVYLPRHTGGVQGADLLRTSEGRISLGQGRRVWIDSRGIMARVSFHFRSTNGNSTRRSLHRQHGSQSARTTTFFHTALRVLRCTVSSSQEEFLSPDSTGAPCSSNSNLFPKGGERQLLFSCRVGPRTGLPGLHWRAADEGDRRSLSA